MIKRDNIFYQAYTGLFCEICNSNIEFEGFIGKVDMLKNAKEYGWKIGKHVKCPYCYTKKKGSSE